MDKITLSASAREDHGKSACRHIRKEGMIPAVVYKDGEGAISLKVDRKELWHALHTDAGSNVIINMRIAAGKKEEEKTVIVKETQVDPLNDKLIHVDFHEISLKDKLTVKVPIEVKGEAVGVLENEGILSQILWEMEVECLPTDIPEHINVNVESLEIGDAIHVKDLELPDNVDPLEDPEQVVVSVHPPQAEEEEEEAEGEEGAVEPELIKKGKAEEEGEEEETGEEKTEEE
jgi:large subunit ribosomal protein L25